MRFKTTSIIPIPATAAAARHTHSVNMESSPVFGPEPPAFEVVTITAPDSEGLVLSLGEGVTLSLGEGVTLSLGKGVTLSLGEGVTLALGEGVGVTDSSFI